MKLKFQANKKEIIIFIIFAIFLLYIVAFGVVNLSSLATEGHFAGFNPIPAFSSQYIAITLGLYFLTLISLFFNISSSFFERKK